MAWGFIMMLPDDDLMISRMTYIYRWHVVKWCWFLMMIIMVSRMTLMTWVKIMMIPDIDYHDFKDEIDDLREYDASCAMWVAMRPDPIAILVGHQGPTHMEKGVLFERVNWFWNMVGEVVYFSGNKNHQRALCFRLCLGIHANHDPCRRRKKANIVSEDKPNLKIVRFSACWILSKTPKP